MFEWFLSSCNLRERIFHSILVGVVENSNVDLSFGKSENSLANLGILQNSSTIWYV